MIAERWCLLVCLADNCWNDSPTRPDCQGEIYYKKLSAENKAVRNKVRQRMYRNSTLVVAFSEDQIPELEAMMEKGRGNGCGPAFPVFSV